jgi:hypothetical protein
MRSESIFPLFFTSALDGGQLQAPAALPQGKAHGTHWRGGWEDTRAGLDAAEWRHNSSPASKPIPAVQSVARRYTDWAIPALYPTKEETFYVNRALI